MESNEGSQVNWREWQRLNVGLEDAESHEFLGIGRIVGKCQFEVSPGNP